MFVLLYRETDAGRLFLVDSIPKLHKDPNAPMLRLFTQVSDVTISSVINIWWFSSLLYFDSIMCVFCKASSFSSHFMHSTHTNAWIIYLINRPNYIMLMIFIFNIWIKIKISSESDIKVPVNQKLRSFLLLYFDIFE